LTSRETEQGWDIAKPNLEGRIMYRRTARLSRTSDAPLTAFEALRAIESRVRLDLRKTIVFGLIALIMLVAGHEVGGVHASSLRMRLISYGCALLTVVFGVAASRTGAREVQRVAVARAGAVAGTPLRLAVLLAGYLVTVISVCDLLGLELRQLLVGGAITGIVVGLAAQPVLSNLFAGLVLLFARPYVPGQQIRVLSGAINGPHTGVIVSAGLLYTLLETDDGPLNIPNSTLLAAAVGPTPTVAEPDGTDGSNAAWAASVANDESEAATPSDGATLATVVAGAESGDGRKPPLQ
jgi:small-conductance mechanosensitive channel